MQYSGSFTIGGIRDQCVALSNNNLLTHSEIFGIDPIVALNTRYGCALRVRCAGKGTGRCSSTSIVCTLAVLPTKMCSFSSFTIITVIQNGRMWAYIIGLFLRQRCKYHYSTFTVDEDSRIRAYILIEKIALFSRAIKIFSLFWLYHVAAANSSRVMVVVPNNKRLSNSPIPVHPAPRNAWEHLEMDDYSPQLDTYKQRKSKPRLSTGFLL